MSSHPPKSGNNFDDGLPAPAGIDHQSYLPEGVAGGSSPVLPKPGLDVAGSGLAPVLEKPGYFRRMQKRTITDWLIDVLTPFMIFVMVFSVIYFLLDVRYVFLNLGSVDRYSQLYDTMLRWVAFCFVVGVVALNRLIARDGRDESILYFFGLALAIGLYTLTTTQAIGSVARNFMNEPVLATGFNMLLVAFIWWLTNRLTHECCVDENPSAGDIGILTGTARRLHKAFSGDVERAVGSHEAGLAVRPTNKKKDIEPYTIYGELQPIDPRELGMRDKKPCPPPEAPSKRLPKRHPGISIFYTSIPAMLIFAIGQRVLLDAGPEMMRKGHYFILSYTLAALMLLMLSSLGGLREYFRSRRINIPAGLGPFWISLGLLMILAVMLAASRMPSPSLPFSPAYQQLAKSNAAVRHDKTSDKKGRGDQSQNPNEDRTSTSRNNEDNQSKDANTGQSQKDDAKGSKSDQNAKDNQGQSQRNSARNQRASQQSQPFEIPPMPALEASGIVKALQWIVIGGMIVFGIYAGLRVLGMLAVALANRRGRGSVMGRIFGAIDRLLQRLTRLPALPTLRPRPRIQRQIAMCTKFSNPLNNRQMTTREMIEYSYGALCALAEDMAVPRRKDQTPYEFIQSFPSPLKTLQDDAIDLTNVYVVSAYSNLEMDEKSLNSVRKFWRSFEQVRRAVVR